MKETRRALNGVRLCGIIILAMLFVAFPSAIVAQNASNNAVYYQVSGVGTCCQGSGAFIDASVFAGSSNPNICNVLYKILNGSLLGSGGYPSTGTVIDARGLNSSIPSFSMTCPTGWTPWNNGSTFVNVPSTILLPAGTIVIPTTWVLPQNTRLIGVGDSISNGSGIGTTIQACKSVSCSFSGDMIDFGPAVYCASGCSGVSVENLVLDGQGQTSVNGIVNQYAQNFAYVDHVSLYQILGVGLSVSNLGGWPSIRAKALSRRGCPGRCEAPPGACSLVTAL